MGETSGGEHGWKVPVTMQTHLFHILKMARIIIEKNGTMNFWTDKNDKFNFPVSLGKLKNILGILTSGVIDDKIGKG